MRRRARMGMAVATAVAVAAGLTGAAAASAASPSPAAGKTGKAGCTKAVGASPEALAPGAAAALKAKLEAAIKAGKAVMVAGPGCVGDPGAVQAKVVAELAQRLGVSTDRIDQALRDLKQNVLGKGERPDSSAAAELFAKDLGIPVAQARSALQHLFQAAEASKGGKVAVRVQPDAFVSALAHQLGVGQDRALQAFKQLDALSAQPGGVQPNSPGFAAIAASLGVSTDRLDQALRAVKQSLAGEIPGDSSASAQASPKG